MKPKHVLTTKPFNKQFKKLPAKVQQMFAVRLELLLQNQDNPPLRVHQLTGEFTGLKSFNVTGDMRVIFDDTASEQVLILVAIGTHSELYG